MVEVNNDFKGYCWLIFALIALVSVNNGWWWMVLLLAWTLLFTAVPHLLNKKDVR